MKTFHVCTISNNLLQYEQMKSSFISAEFSLDICRYSLFDNSEKNYFDPYRTFNKIKAETVEPYIIFCHQDLLVDRGDNFDRLVNLLEELDRLDPKWAIAGNAGMSNELGMIAKITDPNNTIQWMGSLPEQVHSLDENFLVIKTTANIACSEELSGFHLYATDLCLSAHLHQQTCYVIDFHLTHLSGGRLSADYWDVQSKFYQRWCSEFILCYVKTIVGVNMCLSKYPPIRNICSRSRIESWLFSSPLRSLVFLP